MFHHAREVDGQAVLGEARDQLQQPRILPARIVVAEEHLDRSDGAIEGVGERGHRAQSRRNESSWTGPVSSKAAGVTSATGTTTKVVASSSVVTSQRRAPLMR